MLTKNDVLAMRDLALSHLPRVQQRSEIAYAEGRSSKAALQVVATASIGIAASPLSTAIERQAGRLLHLIGRHPDTHTEWLNDEVENDDFAGELTAIFTADAERDRALIDQLLIESARELCRLSGETLPPCMFVDVAPSNSQRVSSEHASTSATTATEGSLQPTTTELGMSKRERQIVAILAAAGAVGYNPMSIPRGGKAALRKACKLSRMDLFGAGDDPFKEAWQEALNQGRLRTIDHDRYAGN